MAFVRAPLVDPSFALKIAEKSVHRKHRHAALIFHNGILVAYANNTPDAHAEIRAIEVAHILGYKKQLTIVSIAINRKGELKLAKPCDRCALHCKLVHINTIMYSTNGQTIIKMEDQEDGGINKEM